MSKKENPKNKAAVGTPENRIVVDPISRI